MPHRSLKQRLRVRLIRRADNVKQNLQILMVGIGIFLLGFAALVVAQFALAESLSREVIALIGLLVAIIGAIIAAFGYISLSLLWLFRFLLTDKPTQDDD